MNCQNHPDVPATAYCRTCGKPVCDACRREAYGTVFCEEHVPALAPGVPPEGARPSAPLGPPPPVAPVPPSYAYANVSPGLAFFLGLIPGVGAIYNGQYAKGLVHAVVFGILVSILDSNPPLEPVFGVGLAAWFFYMAFEAYHTARKRLVGEPVDEYSSLINLHGHPNQVPVAGIALIILGVILLLNTLNLIDFYYVSRYWPVLLILAGAWLLWGRFAGHHAPAEEMRHERR